MKMIILDYQPLTLGERRGMRFFANCAVPGYVPPCYATVRDSLLPAAMKDVEEKLESALRGNNNFTIATDIWTSRRGHPFIAFICTYVNDNFEGKTVLLRCVHMPGHHTGERIQDEYDLCVTKWKINDRVIRVVSDSASNMLRAFRLPGFTTEFEVLFWKTVDPTPSASGSDEGTSGNVSAEAELTESAEAELEMTCEEIQDDEDAPESESNLANAMESVVFRSKQHLPCPIHTMQLAIKDSFDECEDVSALTTKVSKLVSSIRRSSLNTAFTDSLGVRPSVACATRWSSQLRMIESVLKLSEKDADFQAKLSVPAAVKLTATEFRSVASLVQALQPLAELTETLQAEYGTLGLVLPSVTEVQSLLDTVKSPIGIRIFAETLAKNFEERFQKYYSDVDMTVAAVLDPRFKTEWIVRDKNVRGNIVAIRELIAHKAKEASEAMAGRAEAAAAERSCQMSVAQADDNQTNACSKKPRLMFASYSKPAVENTSSPTIVGRTASQELDDYLSSPRLPPSANANPLDFWKVNAATYPQCAALARATFGIPSGSASAERCFSAGGLITRVHRLSMLPTTLEKLVFLKVNSALLCD